MKASPCLTPGCQALNVRNDGEPAPERCPKCQGPVLTVSRKTPNVEVVRERVNP